jgi:hypothetical protein
LRRDAVGVVFQAVHLMDVERLLLAITAPLT